MIHPVFKLIATRPHLLVDHAEAYAELVADEVGNVAGRWKQSLLLISVAICCLGIAGVLAGVALMLWAVSPPANLHAPWALVAAPCAPLLVSIVCVLVAKTGTNVGPLDKVAAQLRADMAMFREVSAA